MYTPSLITCNPMAASTTLPDNIEWATPEEPNVATHSYHWELFKCISSISGGDLDEQQKMLVIESVKLKRLRKWQYFLQEGDVCKYIGFIIKGSTRMFSINERGQESIITFGLENSWIVDHASFHYTDNSIYHIQALENTDVMIIALPELNRLLKKIPAFAVMFYQYQTQQMISHQKRINAALSMTAEERYYDLLNCSPQYAQRFSQNMLACYLGVKPETLSRIRKANH